MANTITTETYAACVDCLMSAAGYSEEETGTPYPTDPAPLSRIEREGLVGVTTGDLLATFSKSPCQACGSPLAGERGEVIALYRV